jgi:hypothetical protein
MAVDLRQTHFRFGKNTGTEAAHLWLGDEDANIFFRVGATFLLRFCVQEAGGTAINNVDNQFTYNLNGVGWVNITTSSAVVKAVASNCWADGDNCTKRLSGSGTFETSASGCTTDGLSGGGTNDIAANGCSETEASLQIVASAVNDGDTIQFRLTSPDGTITYTVTPSLTVIKETLLKTGVQTLDGIARRLLPGLFRRTKDSALSFVGIVAGLFSSGHYSFNGVVSYVRDQAVGGGVKTVEGILNLVGTVLRLIQITRPLQSGVENFVGVVNRLINNLTRSPSGALSFGGLPRRLLSIFRSTYAGVASFAGVVQRIGNLRRTFSGSVIPEGIVTRLINNLTRTYPGSLTLVGDIRRLINNLTRTYSGSITPSGLPSRLINNLTRAYIGTLDFVGIVISSLNAKDLIREYLGEISFSGILHKGLFRTLQAANITFTHILSFIKEISLTVGQGSISFSGKLNRLYESLIDWTVLNFEGGLTHSAILRKFRSGILSFSSFINKGLIRTETATLWFSGEYSYVKSLVGRFITEGRDGIQSFSGDIRRIIQVSKSVQGFLPPKTGPQPPQGFLSFLSSLSLYKILWRAKSRALNLSGCVTGSAFITGITRTYEGAIDISGTIAFIEIYLFGRLSPAVISFAGSVFGSIFVTSRYTAVGVWLAQGISTRKINVFRSIISSLSFSSIEYKLSSIFRRCPGYLSFVSIVEFVKTGGAGSVSAIVDGLLSMAGVSTRQTQLAMAYSGGVSYLSDYSRKTSFFRSLYSGVHPISPSIGSGSDIMAGGDFMMDMTLGV